MQTKSITFPLAKRRPFIQKRRVQQIHPAQSRSNSNGLLVWHKLSRYLRSTSALSRRLSSRCLWRRNDFRVGLDRNHGALPRWRGRGEQSHNVIPALSFAALGIVGVEEKPEEKVKSRRGAARVANSKADPSPVGGASHEKPASSCHTAGVFFTFHLSPFTFHLSRPASSLLCSPRPRQRGSAPRLRLISTSHSSFVNKAA
jgi:hypothetical protein